MARYKIDIYPRTLATHLSISLSVSTHFKEEPQHKILLFFFFFNVLLTVHLSIFILVINQLDAQNLFYIKFISCLYKFRAPCAHRQEIKIVLYSLWYHHTYRWPSRAQVEFVGTELI